MAVSSFVSRVASGGFEALSRALLSFVILDNQINVGVFVVTRMPPKRGQNYTERVNKRRRAADSSATTDSGVQPHPSRLQPVQLQEPSNAARATPQLTLSAEVLAALTNSISAAVSEALLTVAQPLQPAATAAATAFPVAHPSTSAAAAAVPEVQFVPDPISISSAEVVNRGSSVVEANPTTPNADQSVLNTVNNAVQQVTSSLLPGAAPQSKNTFLSTAVPLTHRVPDKVKKQIWSNEYVDFALLLNNSFTHSDDHYTFRVEKGDGGKPALVLAPNPKRQTVQSIEQWVSAFQVFVAIYSEKAPYDTPALMKYGSVIRELASQGANWRFYDENFRSIRQTGGAPWDQIHSELWLRSHSFRPKLSTQPGKSKQQGSFIPKGFCWKFHRGITCPGCSYKHQCFRCGNSHPISKCQQAAKQPAGNAGPKTTSFTSQGTLNRTPSIRSTPNSGQS